MNKKLLVSGGIYIKLEKTKGKNQADQTTVLNSLPQATVWL